LWLHDNHAMITNLTILGRTDDPFVEYSTIDSSIIYRKCGYFFLVRVILDRLSNGDGIAEPEDSVRFRFPPVETRLITAHAVIEPAFKHSEPISVLAPYRFIEDLGALSL